MNAQYPNLSFHDYQPQLSSFREAVMTGLARERKQIAPKFFYDERGSRLFEDILKQPEYYIPDVERALYARFAGEIAALAGKDSILIEPGSGSCEKVRLLLDALRPAAYVPLDICGEFLRESCRHLGEAFPWLPVHATCLDFTQELHLPEAVPEGRKVVFIPGSSLGNFTVSEARTFLRQIRQLVGDDGAMLIGLDRKKDTRILEEAYNDAAGITADFNMNLLVRINNELDGNFDLSAFRHEAFYDDRPGRIEMHLQSLQSQTVDIGGRSFAFAEGERIHTENSYKYHPEEFVRSAGIAGFRSRQMWTDAAQLFGVYFFDAA